jgi:hypothetical protein
VDRAVSAAAAAREAVAAAEAALATAKAVTTQLLKGKEEDSCQLVRLLDNTQFAHAAAAAVEAARDAAQVQASRRTHLPVHKERSTSFVPLNTDCVKPNKGVKGFDGRTEQGHLESIYGLVRRELEHLSP